MDIIDQAAIREQTDRDLALQAHRAAQAIGPSLSHCLECEEPIPIARQQAIYGVTLCIECQRLEETRLRRFAD
jgi:phage/conjugal plasmid C-4 type zinc finger TraR family protein